MLGKTYNATDLPAGNDFEVIPAGWYQAKVKSAELKQTNAGNGEYIKLQLEILGPSHQGRVVFSNLNIMNPNPKAEEIGLSQLNALITAIGLHQINDTDQLINGEAMIKLSIRKSDQYGEQNEVKGYKAIPNSMTGTVSSTSFPMQQQQPQMQQQQPQAQQQHQPAMRPAAPQNGQPLWRQQPQQTQAVIDDDVPF